MAEQKEEKRKPGIVRRIIKWIGLGLLTVLIILGLIFQAPWKITTLLAIILLACTILPKQLRKWFWLSVGVVIIALIIWVLLPDETEGWRPYTFDEELAALEAKRAIPDEENAARIYNELLEIPFPDGNEPNFFVRSSPSAKSGPWLSKDHPKMGEWLEEQEGIIQKLMEASKIEECRFPINADLVSLDSTMNRLPPMRQWAYLLISAATNDVAEGRVDEGLEKYVAVLQMGRHLCQQPTIIDMLVGIALEALAIRQFDRFVVTGAATEEHLIAIEEALEEIKYDWRSDFPRFMEHEKLFAKNFWGLFYGVNPQGKIRLGRGLTGIITEKLLEDVEGKRFVTYLYERLIKAWTILCWFYMPSTPQKAGEIIDAAYERYYAMARTDFNWQKASEKRSMLFQLNYRYMVEHLTGILAPAYHRIHDIYLRASAEKGGGRVIIALRRYKNKTGYWPESLDDIQSLAPVEIFVDPINGNSFIYKLTDDDFTLYSKGKNNIDENGQYNSTWDPNSFEDKVEEDDRLIWPPRTGDCETEEENTDDEQQ